MYLVVAIIVTIQSLQETWFVQIELTNFSKLHVYATSPHYKFSIAILYSV